MKSKLGFIPIVLPVLVMVLIIGLINIGNAPWVQAHDPDGDQDEHTHNIPAADPRMSDLDLYDTSSPTLGAAIPNAISPHFIADDGLHVSSFVASVLYNVEGVRFQPTLTAGSATYKIKKPGDSRFADLHSPDGAESTNYATVKLDVVGRMYEIQIVVTDKTNQGSSDTTYNIELTREFPQFDRLKVTKDGNSLLENNDDGFMGNDRSLFSGDAGVDLAVSYDVRQVDLELTIPESLGGGDDDTNNDAIVAKITGETPTRDTGDGSYDVEGVDLNAGLNTVRITVRDPKKNHQTMYAVVIKRELPQLEAVYLDGGAALINFGESNLATSTSVDYLMDDIRVNAVGGDLVEVRYDQGGIVDSNPATGAFDMDLKPGLNKLTITAYDAEAERVGGTTYTLTVTRARTPLGNLSLGSTSTNNPTDDSLEDVLMYTDAKRMATSVGSMSLNVENSAFDFQPAAHFSNTTTMYYASVPYDVEYVTVNAYPLLESGTPSRAATYQISISLNGRLGTTSAITTIADNTAVPLRAKLRQGTNKIEVVSFIPGNSETYTINIVRNDPVTRPQELRLIEYLVDGNNARPRSIDFGFDSNDMKSSTSSYPVRVRSDVKSVGIVAKHWDRMAVISLNDGLTVITADPYDADLEAISLDDYHQILLKEEGITPVVVTVALGGNKDHITLNIERNDGDPLEFEGDLHPSSPIVVKHGRALANPIVLPKSSSDDGELSYKVMVRDEDGKPVELGELGLKFTPTPGLNSGGHITGAPRPLLANDKAYEAEYRVEYTATDPVGGVAGPLMFEIVITREDVPQIPPQTAPTDDPDNNALKSLRVLVGDKVVALKPSFRSDSEGPYEAEVGSSVSVATVEAKPNNENAIVSMDTAVFVKSEDYQIKTRKFDTQLTIRVSYSGLETKEYGLTIKKKEGPTVGSLSLPEIAEKTYRIDEVIETLMLPEAIGGHLDTSTHMYTLENISEGVNNGKSINESEFGLKYDDKKRELSGTPALTDSYREVYLLRYTVTDGNDDVAQEPFRLIICNPDPAINPRPEECVSSNSDARLSDLMLSGVDIMFDSDDMDYDASVSHETMTTTVTSEGIDDAVSAMVYVGGEMAEDYDTSTPALDIMLEAGTTTIMVKTMKEYGIEFSETYTIDVMRAATPPGPQMTADLTEHRDAGSTMATLTWTPEMRNGAAAAHQWVFSVAKNAGAPVNGVAGLDTDTFSYEPILAGDDYMVDLTGLMADRGYVYGVVALYGGPGTWAFGDWQIINYTR